MVEENSKGSNIITAIINSYKCLPAEIRAKEHIEEIRSKKFLIGAKDPNPLTQDLHRAVISLSAELYTKDVHFLMEIIQNAEDNEYAEGVEPTLEFVLTKRDVTGSGAPATLLVFNNEVGFTSQNMASICSVARSTKEGKRDQGFIGEKGIGFKSVFLVSKAPHIVSNGYKIKFSEEPDSSCGIGYIVPKWIKDKSFISVIHGVYGLSKSLPTTTIVLPLKPDKVEPVKEQLSQLHPELLLFLSKIKRLNVRSSSSYYKDATDICAISISHETKHVAIRSKKADSCVVHLSMKENHDSPEKKGQYYIWRQSFPVKTENKVHARGNVNECVVSLAFPLGDRLTRGSTSVGIFAFLPTAMVTNFPFIIHADFLLASSRESIRLDSKWNLGILKCVPSAFVSAFTSCLKEGSPVSTPAKAFEFLPVKDSSFPELNDVRLSIGLMLLKEKVIPCETFGNGLKFCHPSSAVRILSAFWDLLIGMKQKGVSLEGISSMKKLPIDASLAMEKFDEILDFLCVPSASESYSWYGQCISACKLPSQAPEKEYIDLLYMFADNEEPFPVSFFMKTHLFKFTDRSGVVQLCSAQKTKTEGHKIWYAIEPKLHAWLSICNLEFNCPDNVFFLPDSTLTALVEHEQSSVLNGWLLSHANIKHCSACDYCSFLCDYVSREKDQNLLLKFTYFIYLSHVKGFLSESDLSQFVSMPVIDNLNTIHSGPHTTLVPMEGSKWMKLFGPTNPFSSHGYCDLGTVYSAGGRFAGEHISQNALLSFLSEHTGAADIPDLIPPDIALPAASSKLTSERAFLLLDWIKFCRTQKTPPPKFISSIRNGKWMKTYSGFNSPSKCMVLVDTEMSIFQMTACVLTGFAVLDEAYYENRTAQYSDELKYLGVTLGLNDVQKVAMSRFKEAASSEMSKDCVFSLLTFIGFLDERNMLHKGWLAIMKKGRWLKTYKGIYPPEKAVFLRSEDDSEAASRITNMPIIDRTFYGSRLDTFSDELALLGVKSDPVAYKLVSEQIVFPDTESMTSGCGLFVLECIRRLHPANTALIQKMKKQPWLKTITGFQLPVSTVLPSPNLLCLTSIEDVPIIDEAYYGSSIRSYTDELRLLGVGLDFESTLKIVGHRIHELASSSNMSPSGMISLLQAVKDTLKTMPSQLDKICEVVSGEALFKTRHGYRRPQEAILSTHYWGSISLFVDLPTIDDSYYSFQIYDYRNELEVLGVIVALEVGAKFVAEGLTRPIKAGLITADGALTLLRCVRVLMSQIHENDAPFSAFLMNIRASDFLRTTLGYRSPTKSVLLQPQWKHILQLTDLPFLDDSHYGNHIYEYRDELKTLGVKVDEIDACHFLSESLYSLTETSSIERCYRFVFKYSSLDQVFRDKAEISRVWIADKNDSDRGQWVTPETCIVHDRDKLFDSLFHCLDNYYDDELLPLFSQAFGVAEYPGLSHYMQLWRRWLKRENRKLSATECNAFLCYITDNWNSETREILVENLTELPAMSSAGTEVRLVSKEQLFFPNDLLLKSKFTALGECPRFVWVPPEPSSLIHAKLCSLYSVLGVKSLSESVELEVQSFQVLDQGSCVGMRKKLISRGLVKIILSYLAAPKVNVGVKSRHEAVKSLLNLTVSVSDGPILVTYRLHQPNCKPLEVESAKVVHWDKISCSLLVQKSSYEKRKSGIEFGSYFSQELAELVLARERPLMVNDLQKIIHLGLVYEFEDSSVDFLLARENLELFVEDEKFLSDAFSSEQLQAEGPCKRICPFSPVPSSKKPRQ